MHDSKYILNINKNNNISRKIYFNQKLTEEEEKRIDKLELELKKASF